MTDLVIASPALGDAATITASTVMAGAPAAHLQTSQPGEAWRSTDTGPVLTVDLKAPRAPRLIALLYTSLTDVATWSIAAASDLADLPGAPGFTVASRLCRSTLPRDARGWRHALAWLGATPAAARTYRYWRIALSDPTAAEGVSAGRLVISEGWTPAINLDRGWRLVRRDPSEALRLPTGQLRTIERQPYDELTLTLSWLSRTEAYIELAPLLDRVGRGAGGDLFVVRDATAADWDAEAVYGPLADDRSVTHPYLEYYRTTLKIVERTP